MKPAGWIPNWPSLPRAATRRMGANPHANGGLLLRDSAPAGFPRLCRDSDQRRAASTPKRRACRDELIRDVMKLNPRRTFRVFSPDETASNRWSAVFEVTNRCSTAEIRSGRRPPRAGWPGDGGAERAPVPGLARRVSADRPARVLFLLRSVHSHRRFDVQPACQVARRLREHIPWRRPIASLNYLLTSHVWRQDHNGFSHQDPGFIDHVVNKKAEVIRVYLPPDANTLLSVTDHCLRSRNYVNVIVAGKQPAPQWLDMDAAIKHCTAGVGIWEWASNDQGGEPDVVMACCRRCADARNAGRSGFPAAALPGSQRFASSTSSI